MVNVYANKKGLAKTLAEAGYLSGEAELESFFRQFNQSQPLFHFIDCGYGKESADAKLRGESPNLRNALACFTRGSSISSGAPPSRARRPPVANLTSLDIPAFIVLILSMTQIHTDSSPIIVTVVTYY